MIFTETDPDIPITSQTILMCSAISKMTASIATYPHEVVRTRLQTQRRPLADDLSSDGMIKQHSKRGIVYTTKKLIIKEGWTSLYKGLSINLIRTVPNSAVTMLTCVFFSFVVENNFTEILLKIRTPHETSLITDFMTNLVIPHSPSHLTFTH